MSVEAAVSLFAAWRARSPALLAFGGDSAIELASAVVVLWRFSANAPSEHAERSAARIGGTLLFALAMYVVVVSVTALLGDSEPKPTLLGLGILIAAAFMPLRAREKRLLSAQTGSASLRADAAESAFCGYFAWIALAGLVVNAIWHLKWADPVLACNAERAGGIDAAAAGTTVFYLVRAPVRVLFLELITRPCGVFAAKEQQERRRKTQRLA